MAKKNVIIVGGGLFGCVAAALAERAGHTCTVVDAGERYAASRASGCVLAPSWLSSLSTEQIDAGMEVLTSLYKVEPVKFRTHLGLHFNAARIDPDTILARDIVRSRVVGVSDGAVKLDNGQQLKGYILLATGIWTPDLVPSMPKVKALYGASVRFSARIAEPRLSVYAPYRQAVAFQLNSRQVWFGDGTALITSTWAKEEADRIAATQQRGYDLLGLKERVAAKVYAGARPYVEGHKAGYYVQLAPKLHVSTGGAKNGTILAAYQAHRYVTEVLR